MANRMIEMLIPWSEINEDKGKERIICSIQHVFLHDHRYNSLYSQCLMSNGYLTPPRKALGSRSSDKANAPENKFLTYCPQTAHVCLFILQTLILSILHSDMQSVNRTHLLSIDLTGWVCESSDK